MTILKISYAIAIIIYFSFLVFLGLDPDFGWHLRIGQEITQNSKIPLNDTLTFSMAGHGWVDHEWLVNMALYQMRRHWIFVNFVFVALAAIPFIYYIKKCRNWWQLAMVFAVAVSFGAFLFVRVAIISFFLFWWLWTRLNGKFYTLKHKNWAEIGILAVLMYFWSGLHAGFVQGLFLIGLFYLYKWIATIKIDYEFSLKNYDIKDILKRWPQMKFDIAVVLILAGVTLLHPYGFGLWEEILRIMQSSETHKYINEWLPGLISRNAISLIYTIPLSVYLYRYRKNIFQNRNYFIAAIFLILYLFSQRQYMQLVIVGLPLMIKMFDDVLLKEKKKYLNIVFGFIMAYALLYGFISIIQRDINNTYPIQAIKVLKEYSQNNYVRLFNDYGYGGLISWQTPKIKYLIDGRMPHWKVNDWSLLEDYMQAYYFGNQQIQQKLLDEYYFNAALLSKKVIPDRGVPLKDNLLDKHWRILYEDELSILLIDK